MVKLNKEKRSKEANPAKRRKKHVEHHLESKYHKAIETSKNDHQFLLSQYHKMEHMFMKQKRRHECMRKAKENIDRKISQFEHHLGS